MDVSHQYAVLKARDIRTWSSLALCVFGLLGAWGRPEFIVVPLLIGAGWLMAMADETRVFAVLVPYAASFMTSYWVI